MSNRSTDPPNLAPFLPVPLEVLLLLCCPSRQYVVEHKESIRSGSGNGSKLYKLGRLRGAARVVDTDRGTSAKK
jgi:hypothetical protein